MSEQDNEKEQRFVKVYKAYVDEVYQFIFTRSGFDSTIAEDITQDIFLDIFKGLNRFKGLCSERTWVFKIARNKLNDFYRKQYGQRFDTCEIDEADQISDPQQNITLQLEKSYESLVVRDCLNKLSLHYRIILLMKYADGKSVKQIAENLNKTPKAIESMLQRAKGTFIKEYQMVKEKEECWDEENT